VGTKKSLKNVLTEEKLDAIGIRLEEEEVNVFWSFNEVPCCYRFGAVQSDSRTVLSAQTAKQEPGIGIQLSS
jgi:hypothetical protein